MLAQGLTLALAVSCGTQNTYDAGTSLRRIMGTDLIGAKGATPEDQRKIDRTMVGPCANKVFTSAECQKHWSS